MDTSSSKRDFVKVNEIRLHYLDWGGEGPALVFLTGMTCSAYICNSLAPRFAAKFHVLALDRRGHGDSDYPEIGYDPLTEDLRQFLDALKIDQAILVGHSMSHIELSRFAVLYPERLLKLVFLDAAYNSSSLEFKAVMARILCRKLSPHRRWITPIISRILLPSSKGCPLSGNDLGRSDRGASLPHASVVEIPSGHHYCFIKQEETVFD